MRGLAVPEIQKETRTQSRLNRLQNIGSSEGEMGLLYKITTLHTENDDGHHEEELLRALP